MVMHHCDKDEIHCHKGLEQGKRVRQDEAMHVPMYAHVSSWVVPDSHSSTQSRSGYNRKYDLGNFKLIWPRPR
jgi:hypothetical protein